MMRAALALALVAGASAHGENDGKGRGGVTGPIKPRINSVNCRPGDDGYYRIVDMDQLKAGHKGFLAVADAGGEAPWGYSHCGDKLTSSLSSVENTIPFRASATGSAKVRFQVDSCEAKPFMQVLSAPFREKQCELSKAFVDFGFHRLALEIEVSASAARPTSAEAAAIVGRLVADAGLTAKDVFVGVRSLANGGYTLVARFAAEEDTVYTKLSRRLNIDLTDMSKPAVDFGAQYLAALEESESRFVAADASITAAPFSTSFPVAVLPNGQVPKSTSDILNAYGVDATKQTETTNDLVELANMVSNLVRGQGQREAVKTRLRNNGISNPMELVNTYSMVITKALPTSFKLNFDGYDALSLMAEPDTPDAIMDLYQIAEVDRPLTYAALDELARLVEDSITDERRAPILAELRTMGIPNGMEIITTHPTVFGSAHTRMAFTELGFMETMASGVGVSDRSALTTHLQTLQALIKADGGRTANNKASWNAAKLQAETLGLANPGQILMRHPHLFGTL